MQDGRTNGHSASSVNVRDLIVDDLTQELFRVNRSTMTSQEIYELEKEKIFNECWIYLGHETEVENPGEFKSRDVAGRALFFTRTKAGEIKVFHNTCPHRGAVICRQKEGKRNAFQCFYHAWTFNNEGQLISLPDEAGYGKQFDKAKQGLKSPPRVESYRGLIFISFNPEIEDLVTYLAGAREYLDYFLDAAEEGYRVAHGTNEYAITANWKLLCENSIDGYHAASTHQTYFEYLKDLGTDLSVGVSGIGLELGNGHGVVAYNSPWGRPVAKWEPLWSEEVKEELDQIRDELVEKYGEKRARIMTDVNRNLLIYPNLVINDIMSLTLRTFWPVAPDRMEITAWTLVPKDESGERLARRLDSFLTFLGPGGFATPDDVEALESCQRGFESGGVEWNDISRGMSHEARAADELQMRGFWRRWRDQMSGHTGPTEPVEAAGNVEQIAEQAIEIDRAVRQKAEA